MEQMELLILIRLVETQRQKLKNITIKDICANKLPEMKIKFLFQINRLPGMHSSNLMSDTLSGRDEMIDFEDILNSTLKNITIYIFCFVI